MDLFLVVFVGFAFALAKIGKVNETSKPEFFLQLRLFNSQSAKKNLVFLFLSFEGYTFVGDIHQRHKN